MNRRLATTVVAALLFGANVAGAAAPGHYLFAWAGDTTGRGEDFIAVIDGEPASPGYGRLIASAASGIRSQQVHHTEYWMPAGGLLFANDHKAGRTVVIDLRDPLHPQVHAAFGDWMASAILIRSCDYPTATCWQVSRSRAIWITARIEKWTMTRQP